MSDVQALATGAGGHLLLLGSSDGISMYKLSTSGPLCRILPAPREPQNSHGVGGPVRLLAVLGETPLIAFTLDGNLSRPQEALPVFTAKNAEEHEPCVESVAMPTSRVLHLYDASQQQFLAELHFKTAVVGVRLNSVRLAVALEACVHLFDLRTLRHLAELRTTAPRNPRGIIALSEPTTNARGEPVSYLAVPQSDCGQGDVSVTQIAQPYGEACAENTGNVRTEVVERVANLSAHHCAITCLAMTRDGTRLATASERGTTVKVFETATERPLFAFRRGLARAQMLSLAFDATGLRIAALSTRGTLHVFCCAASGGCAGPAGGAPASGYFGGEERSFAQAPLSPGPARECFFADDGRVVWVVHPPLAGEQRAWSLQQYAISGNACELVHAHTIRV